jgi:hypothetical protein
MPSFAAKLVALGEVSRASKAKPQTPYHKATKPKAARCCVDFEPLAFPPGYAYTVSSFPIPFVDLSNAALCTLSTRPNFSFLTPRLPSGVSIAGNARQAGCRSKRWLVRTGCPRPQLS